MASAKQFKGQCYAGYQKFDIHFSVSSHGSIELAYDDGKKLDIPLQQTALELMGDPETTLQISWTETRGLHVLQSRDPAVFDRLLSIKLPTAIQAQVLGLQKKTTATFEKRTPARTSIPGSHHCIFIRLVFPVKSFGVVCHGIDSL